VKLAWRVTLAMPLGHIQNPIRGVQRFRSGLVFKAHILLYHSALGLRVIKQKKRHMIGRRRFNPGVSGCTRVKLAWRLTLAMPFGQMQNPLISKKSECRACVERVLY